MHIRGKVALVTGGSRGLGAAICRALAAEGASVAVNYASAREKAEAVAAELTQQHGVKAAVFGADVTDETQVCSLFDRVEVELGPVDILVNNAGICPVVSIVDTEFEEWQQVLRSNVDSVFLCSREFARRRIALGQGGRIVNIVSQAAYNGSKRGKTPYSASKGAVVSFTVSFAKEVAKDGIYVNAVAPGMMDTDMVAETLALPHEREKYNASIPLGRLGTVEEVARMVTFLCAETASYSTGGVFDATGGLMSR